MGDKVTWNHPAQHRWRFTLVWGVIVLHLLSCEDNPDAHVCESLENKMLSLARAHGIAITDSGTSFPITTAGGEVNAQICSLSSAGAYVNLLLEELSIYPSVFIRAIGLRRILLCAWLTRDGQAREAVMDLQRSELYLDVVRSEGKPCYLRYIIHHEIFHLFDHVDDNEVLRDVSWSALNPIGFAYGHGGRAMQEVPDVGALTNDIYGFTTKYATSGPEEDKAEVFAAMVVFPQFIAYRGLGDGVIHAKVQRIQRLLERICPSMDIEFWNRIKALRRDVQCRVYSSSCCPNGRLAGR